MVQKYMNERNLHKLDSSKEYYQRQNLWTRIHRLQHNLQDNVKDLDAEKTKYAQEKSESTKEIEILKDNLAKEKALDNNDKVRTQYDLLLKKDETQTN